MDVWSPPANGAITEYPACAKWQSSRFSAGRQKTRFYRIEKRPKLRGRQGQYAVIGMDGQILKRGADLKTVLRVLERKLIRAVD